MNCPRCKESTQVLDSRDSGEEVRRRRECPSCKYRFTTYERAELASLTVEKKDGRRERFAPEKIRRGVATACKNRPVDAAAIDRLVDLAEQQLAAACRDSVSSREIGEIVGRLLRELDEVAYVRFVSVYQAFDDVKEFEAAVEQINSA